METMNSQNYKYSVILFYKYVQDYVPHNFRDEHYQFCIDNNLKGRVFIADEGIIGPVSGVKEDIKRYKKHLRSYEIFKDIYLKQDEAEARAFKKMHVRVKNEIVS